jgi:hypothetical protein
MSGEPTDFERRMIAAARDKRPSAASSERMAKALGVTLTSLGAAAGSKALAAKAVASTATAAAGTSPVWPWISVGVVGLVVAGSVVGARVRHPARPQPAAVSAPQQAPATPAPAPLQPVPLPATAATTERSSAPGAPRHHARVAVAESDLGEQIAMVDGAREALARGAPQRALEILRRYQDRYPSGSFRPEATATSVEALVKLDRQAEARALATRFVADHKGSLLAARVAELVGLPVSPSP